jgi:hypothetical protein
LSVKALGREIYRLTREKNGSWIARKLGKLVGDIIQLVRRLEQRGGYAEALYRLTRGPTVTLQPPNRRALAREAQEARQAEEALAAAARPAREQDAARLAELRRQAGERDRPQRPDRDRGHSIGM